MGLSIRAYARHRGVSHVAVKKAIDTGRITPQADGTIEPNRADLEWAQNTVAARNADSCSAVVCTWSCVVTRGSTSRRRPADCCLGVLRRGWCGTLG